MLDGLRLSHPRTDWEGEPTDQGLDELREASLRYIILLTAACHFIWNTGLTAISVGDVAAKVWLLAPLVVGGEALTYHLLSSGRRSAGIFFSVWGLTAVTAGTVVFHSLEALPLYALLALATSIVLGPLAGLLTVVGQAVLSLAALWVLPGPWLQPERLAAGIMFSALTVAVAWSLMHGLHVAVSWSASSYEQARRSMRDAQEHRAKLVQALSQLDTAYYRLQRVNAALAEAWRRADEAERAKAEFVSNISHELRTPLNLIIGFSEMMISAPETYGAEPLPREYRGDLNAIYRSSQHLLALTNDVLDLAQAEVSRLALVAEPADLAEVVTDTVDLVREYVLAKGLRLDVRVEPGLPSIRLDRLRIRQVLLNLLTNAARFTEVGGIAVTVTREGPYAEVSVRDTGSGISPGKVGRIFEEFQHVDVRAARDHLSTGLGLAISRRFVELHHGSMSVESEVGKGTTFRFRLPIVHEEPDEFTPGRRGQSVGASPSERVLVLVHEDRTLRHIFQRRLAGFRIVSAPDMQTASSVAEELRATAIVVDADLADDTRTAAPVIRCSLPHKSQLKTMLGVSDYLVKPVGRADLRSALDRLRVPLRRVLVVDDDIRATRLLTRLLRASGRDCEVQVAHNGDEALEVLESARPDLMILDLMMPGRSGEEVLEAMTERPQLADLPVIVVSARGPNEERLPLLGTLTLSKDEGLQMSELLDALDALLATLRPPRAYLSATEPTPR